MIDYYCEMHGCKFIPLVSSIFVRARRRSYKCAPVISDVCHLEAKGTLGGERKTFWIFSTIPPPFYTIHATYMYCHTKRDALPSEHEKWRHLLK